MEEKSAADLTLAFERLVDAPRERVFEAWTDPEHLAHWWGPDGFRTTTHAMDLRVGGEWRFTMHGPDGTDYPNLVRYEEIVRPERLVYAHYGEGPALHFRMTATFAQEGGRTRVAMRMAFETAQEYARTKPYAEPGAQQTLGRLARYVATSAGGPR